MYIHMHTHPKTVSGCILLLDNITEGMFANQVGEIDFSDKVSLHIQLNLVCTYWQCNVSALTVYELYFLHVTVYCCNFKF